MKRIAIIDVNNPEECPYRSTIHKDCKKLIEWHSGDMDVDDICQCTCMGEVVGKDGAKYMMATFPPQCPLEVVEDDFKL